MPGDEAETLLKQYLAERDVPCPVCKYNVRSLTTDVCPECGERLGLALKAIDQRYGAWIAALIGASCGLGFYLAISGLFLWMGLWSGWAPSPTGGEIATLLIGLGISVGVELLLLVFSRRFRRLKPGIAWTLALACWMISVVSCIAFMSHVQ